MTIEQEFFKAFELIECEKCNHKYCSLVGQINYPTSCADRKHIKITPEIVLGLEEIILDKFGCFDYIKSPQYQNVYQIRISKDALNGAFYSTIKYEQGNAREDALLKLCIQLKDEIQDQVRGLFNE